MHEMSEANLGAEFLQKKYRLNTDPNVVSAAEHRKQRAGELLPQHDYPSRIQNYLDMLNKFISPKTPKGEIDTVRKQENLERLKRPLYDQIIIKPKEIPESYFQSILKRQEEEGRPIEEIPEETKKNLIDVLIKDQRDSLDIWINYLASPDAKYPDWFKYHALRSVLVMGRYDKGKNKFIERSKTGKSVSQFPELIRDALSFVSDALTKKQEGSLGNLKYGYGIKPEEKAEFEKLLKEGDPNFARLYAWAIDKITPISEELLQQTKGQWVKYPQGSDPKAVVEALAKYGTGWCIRGEGTASEYLESSDLEIYYSLDENNKPKVPRIVIVTRQGRIDEVRGVAKEEHWDSYIADIVEQKLAKLPDGEKFKKRVADMQKMTAIHRKSFSVDRKSGVKTYLNTSLTKEELAFLYEIDSKIEGFGYQVPDPRITEVRGRRNPEEDMLVIFNCEKSQIAANPSEINENTKAYIGSLLHHDSNGKIIPIFKLFKKYHIEQVYTSFPEGKITFEDLEIGGKSAKELKKEIKEEMNISDYADNMLENEAFTTLKSSQTLHTVRLRVQDLGFSENETPTTDQLYQRAKDLGLNLCPAETGPHKRLKDKNQPFDDWYRIAMKPIAGRDGLPSVFWLARIDDSLWLDGLLARPADRWNPKNEFVFERVLFSPSKAYIQAGFFLTRISRLFFHPPSILPTSSSFIAASS